MPGRRLTNQDRRHIAVGLARGLDYAEIARQLHRPTSTVSREVNRNGGPARYRADLAQLATAHRARRTSLRPQTAQHPAGPNAGMVAAFVSEFTEALVDTGLPRTAAGVMARLYTAESGSSTAAELTQQLQVSAATISTAIALLEDQALIRRARDDHSRRQRYFIDEDAGFRTTVAGASANQRLADTARRGAAIFGDGTATGARLGMTGRFLDQLSHDIIRSAEHWRDVIGPTRPRGL